MQALGMIETRGFLAALEASDKMLKTADVHLLDKSYCGPLVTVTISGDVAAAKAAVDSATASILHLWPDFMVSHHVIPRPSQNIVLNPDPVVERDVNVPEEELDAKFDWHLALGMVETKGYVGTVAALDVMEKAADVALIGRENVRYFHHFDQGRCGRGQGICGCRRRRRRRHGRTAGHPCDSPAPSGNCALFPQAEGAEGRACSG